MLVEFILVGFKKASSNWRINRVNLKYEKSQSIEVCDFLFGLFVFGQMAVMKAYATRIGGPCEMPSIKYLSIE